MNRIDKLPASLTNIKWEKTQTIDIKTKTRDKTNDSVAIKRNTKNNYNYKFKSFKEIEQFLKKHKLVKLKQDEMDNLNILITIKEA